MKQDIEKIVNYKIKESMAKAIRKVLAKINDVDFRGNFGLSDKEISDVHFYMDNVDVE